MEETKYFVCGGSERVDNHPTARLGFSFDAAKPKISVPRLGSAGEWMVLDDSVQPNYPIPPELVEQLEHLCQTRYVGLICDFEQAITQPFYNLVGQISNRFQRQNLGLMVPEAYAAATAYGRIIGQTSPLDGDFIAQCNRLHQRYGNRLVLEVAAISMEVALPIQRGVSPAKIIPSTGFYASALGCNYRFHGDSVTLFDTAETVKSRMDMAKNVGITKFIALYQELFIL